MIFALVSQAAIRDSLIYQGKILDSSMLPPLDGNYNMQFRIYDSLVGGNLLWTETWNGANQVAIRDGVFTVELNNICASWTGACASNGGVNWSTDSLYLQIGFDADGNGSFEEIFAPRKRFTAVPYAQMAARLETSSNILFTDNSDHSLTWNQSVDRTLTVENTNAGSVANLSVEGQVRVGQFAVAPTALGNGALYYNTTNHNLYLYKNSAWQVVGGVANSIWDADADTGIQTEKNADEDKIRFDIGNTSGTAYPDILVLDGTNGFVWNDSGAASLDFRVEGDTESNLVFVDASADKVGFGNSTPGARVDITAADANALRINPYDTGAGNMGELQFMELVANGSNYVGFKAPDSITTSLAWVLPSTDGSAGAVLKTDGAGNLGWATSLKSLWDDDTDTGIQVEKTADDDTIRFNLGITASDALKLTQATGFVWNDAGLSTLDVRMASDTDDNLFFLDAGNNNIGIGEAAPDTNAKLEVAGNLMIGNYLYFQNATTDYLRFDGSDFILSNDLLPSANSTYNLGSSTRRWNKTYIGGNSLHIGVDSNDYDISYDTVAASLVFNEAGENTSFRLEGTTNPNLLFVDAGQNSVAVGTNSILSSAIFQIDSTTQGALLPRMTNAQMTGIGTPATGLLVYDTTNNKLNYFNGTAWSPFVSERTITLDMAYKGLNNVDSGRTITVGGAAVQMIGSNASDETLEVSNTNNGGVLLLTNNGTGVGLALSNTGNGIGMSITNAGTGNGLFIDNNNATSIGLNIDSESTGTGAISVTHQGDNNLTNAALYITAENGSGAMYLYRNQAAAVTDQPLVYLDEAGNADTNVLHILNAGTGLAFYANQSNTGTTTDAAAILNAGNSNTLHLAQSSNTANATGTGAALYIAGTTASTAGDNNGISDARNGYGLYINSEESNGTTVIFGLESDNVTGGQTADTEHFYVRADGVAKVYGGTATPTRNVNGEFGFRYVNATTQRLYFRAGGVNAFINRSGAGDYSEYFKTNDKSIREDWGTVVIADNSGSELKVASSYLEKDKNVLGVVSEFGTRNNDDLELGNRHELPEYVNVAMLGQVPVKVTNQNGAIAVGDYLTTSSVIGHAMKADPGDPILGIAMEPFSGSAQSSEGMINCLLSRNNQGNISALLKDLQERKTLTAEDVLAVLNNENLALNYLVLTKGEVMQGLKIHGQLELDRQNIGTAVVLAGDQRVRVYFPERFRVKPVVTVTPELSENNDIFFDFQYLLYDVNEDGFSIKLNQPLAYNLRFNWHAFAQANYTDSFDINLPPAQPVNKIQPLISFDCRSDNLSACVTARDCWQFSDIAKWTGSVCVLK